ncbi:ComE operon protein 2 [Metabacillus rhizolycopersici]|uniref:ComE operon protein 2 n=1 Tax=Metabacillus rhizolycopersici TaxID=2875709 RepID=A0ABS7UM77_9BACI|nr:ComE operon protein 2 [Metabacillus rhizolycopersici]MBZ5749314.1 ComE operon protein 2 [Metabacillus rhizolycopersici]
MNRISWNQYFMSQSHLLSRRSTCTRLAVGATIVREKRMIAGGYNGSIAGGAHCSDEGCYVIDNHCVRTIHAEMNALLQCAKFGVPTEGAEIYVTHFPCLQCCKALIQSGIKTVYYAVDYKNHPYAVELFNQAKVKVVQVQLEKSQDDETKQEFMSNLLDKLAETNMNKEEIQALYKKAELLFS